MRPLARPTAASRAAAMRSERSLRSSWGSASRTSISRLRSALRQRDTSLQASDGGSAAENSSSSSCMKQGGEA